MRLCKFFGAELTLRWNKLIIELGNELWFYPKRFEIVYCSTGHRTVIILCIQCDIYKVVSKLLSVSSGPITEFGARKQQWHAVDRTRNCFILFDSREYFHRN